MEVKPVTVIRLAGEPQGKGRPRFSRKSSHAYTPEKTRNYETCLRLAAQDVMGDRIPTGWPLVVRMTASFAIPGSWSQKRRDLALAGIEKPAKKPDCDNIAKAIDALNGIVFHDDKQVVEQTVIKKYAENPGLLIEIWPAAFLNSEPA